MGSEDILKMPCKCIDFKNIRSAPTMATVLYYRIPLGVFFEWLNDLLNDVVILSFAKAVALPKSTERYILEFVALFKILLSARSLVF